MGLLLEGEEWLEQAVGEMIGRPEISRQIASAEIGTPAERFALGSRVELIRLSYARFCNPRVTRMQKRRAKAGNGELNQNTQPRESLAGFRRTWHRFARKSNLKTGPATRLGCPTARMSKEFFWDRPPKRAERKSSVTRMQHQPPFRIGST